MKKKSCSCGNGEPDADDKPKRRVKSANFGGKQAPPFKAKGRVKKGK